MHLRVRGYNVGEKGNWRVNVSSCDGGGEDVVALGLFIRAEGGMHANKSVAVNNGL